ncbi:nitroreductase/quinone reductase family protein, partial [Ferrimicrobium acidiphilum]
MPLSGEYEPSTQEWVRNQVDLYERTNGQQGGTLSDTGLPVIILWTLGAKTGK